MIRIRLEDTMAVAVADGRPGGEVLYWGNIQISPERLRVLAKKLAGRYAHVVFTVICWEG
jgi:hypothetical protein